jgi:hypothetical protein
MANIKTGMAYYNVDTDRYQDVRIKKLKKAYRCTGIALYDYILCEIYRENGCFVRWDKSSVFDCADYFYLREIQVNEVVKYCCFVGLFDRKVFESSNILTSAAIQKRYAEMCVRTNRNFTIPEECKILNDSKVGQNLIFDDKEKERKIKNLKSKEEREEKKPSPLFQNDFDFDSIVKLFQTTCPSLNSSNLLKMPNGIKKKIARRLPEIGGVEKLKEIFEKVEKSDFLNGSKQGQWRATLDWIFGTDRDGAENWAKILNGTYDNNNNNKNLKNDTINGIFRPQCSGYGKSTL